MFVTLDLNVKGRNAKEDVTSTARALVNSSKTLDVPMIVFQTNTTQNTVMNVTIARIK